MFNWIGAKANLNEKVVIGLIALLLLGGGVWRGLESRTGVPELVQADLGSTGPEAEPEPALITVHLAGAVVNPGVYHLPAGSRVYELLDLAGGFSDEADRDYINQARPLMDGEQVYVLKHSEDSSISSTLAAGGAAKININIASAAELTSLPGIGEVRANQIVAHREKHGLFTDVKELMDVSGIGEKTFENIAELITIY
jgi:competence protein ComEA